MFDSGHPLRYTVEMLGKRTTPTPAHNDKADRMQRVRVGLTGLAVVVLIVALATFVITYISRQAPVPAIPAANHSDDEPLADLGMAPGAPENKSQ